MQLIFDVSIVVDICAAREPFASRALLVEKWARRNAVPVRMYTGSVQTLHSVLAAALADHDRSSGENQKTADFYLKKAGEILNNYTRDIQWLSALSEDGPVFADGDPEAAQLLKALSRLGEDAFLLTRNDRLLSRSAQAMCPEDFLALHASSDVLNENIPFCDLKAQLATFRPDMEKALLETVESTAYIKGPAVGKLEEELSGYLDADIESIACASGTDALLIALMALEVKPGDEVIIPDFTFIATGEVIALLGAIPVFCDVKADSYNMDPDKIEELISDRTAGIIPVSIFGQCADMDRINAIAERHSLWVMEDAAQSFGAEYKGKKSCTLSRVSTTSFFPAKPLGCYGDGGAIFTSDPELAVKMRTILNHGQKERYRHSLIGVNGRLDTLQAAVLSVKLKTFPEELQLRQEVARTYSGKLKSAGVDTLVKLPQVMEYNSSVWAQYTLRHSDKEALRQELQEKGIPTAVHYPVPLHDQEAFSYLFRDSNAQVVSCPVTETVSTEVFSLPMHPFLKDAEIDRVVDAVASFVRK